MKRDSRNTKRNKAKNRKTENKAARDLCTSEF